MTSRSCFRRQVSLTGFDNEPMAKLAEQVLKGEEIPCFMRPLRGGSGLWGSAFNLSHDILVYEQDVERAREALELPTLDPDQADGSEGTGSARNLSLILLGSTIAILAVSIILKIVG